LNEAIHFDHTFASRHSQPVEVGRNRSIKKEMTEQWEEWMINGGGVEDGVANRQQEGRWQNGHRTDSQK
jgi:hypothetical protein